VSELSSSHFYKNLNSNNMKSIFKVLGFKEPTLVAEVIATELVKSNYPKEVLEIHHEFEIASEKLLEEANNIINTQPKVNKSKIERLSKFGFQQVKEVKDSVKILEVTKMSEETINIVNYFKREYPFQKFITEEQVEYICHKYNLVCGDVSRFRGFVPDKNLKEIENFKLKSKDDMSPKLGEFYIIKNDFTLINIKDVEKEGYKFYGNKNLDWLLNKYLPNNNYSYLGTSSSSSETNIPGWGKTFQYRINNLEDFDIKKAIEFNTQTLKICAPVKDMDISGLELKNGYKLEAKKHIPDPIVLQPVKGGYLILTMWADETFDPYTEPILRNDEMLN